MSHLWLGLIHKYVQLGFFSFFWKRGWLLIISRLLKRHMQIYKICTSVRSCLSVTSVSHTFRLGGEDDLIRAQCALRKTWPKAANVQVIVKRGKYPSSWRASSLWCLVHKKGNSSICTSPRASNSSINYLLTAFSFLPHGRTWERWRLWILWAKSSDWSYKR